jgi:uncharacterized membrane protein
MRAIRLFTALVVAASLIFSACSASSLLQEVDNAQVKVELVHQAWKAARLRLHRMCPRVPRTEDELAQALNVEQENGCYARLAKNTFMPSLDDWHWHWLPLYQVVAAVHDEELRKRVIPKFYEEYISGLNRYLAEKVDNGEITPGQFRYAIDAGWSWLTGKMRNERILLQENMRVAEDTEAATRSTLSDVAGELATVATVALAISAPDKTYQPAPANCYAYPAEEGTYTIVCY